MSEMETANFGRITYEENAVLSFPAGIPGFEQERAFLTLSRPRQDPLIFLQSLRNPDLCFVTLPVYQIDSTYRLHPAEDLAIIELNPESDFQPGADLLCLSIVTIGQDGVATANLLAPVVLNLRRLLGAQIVQADSHYSHQHRLGGFGWKQSCS